MERFLDGLGTEQIRWVRKKHTDKHVAISRLQCTEIDELTKETVPRVNTQHLLDLGDEVSILYNSIYADILEKIHLNQTSSDFYDTAMKVEGYRIFFKRLWISGDFEHLILLYADLNEKSPSLLEQIWNRTINKNMLIRTKWNDFGLELIYLRIKDTFPEVWLKMMHPKDGVARLTTNHIKALADVNKLHCIFLDLVNKAVKDKNRFFAYKVQNVFNNLSTIQQTKLLEPWKFTNNPLVIALKEMSSLELPTEAEANRHEGDVRTPPKFITSRFIAFKEDIRSYLASPTETGKNKLRTQFDEISASSYFDLFLKQLQLDPELAKKIDGLYDLNPATINILQRISTQGIEELTEQELNHLLILRNVLGVFEHIPLTLEFPNLHKLCKMIIEHTKPNHPLYYQISQILNKLNSWAVQDLKAKEAGRELTVIESGSDSHAELEILPIPVTTSIRDEKVRLKRNRLASAFSRPLTSVSVGSEVESKEKTDASVNLVQRDVTKIREFLEIDVQQIVTVAKILKTVDPGFLKELTDNAGKLRRLFEAQAKTQYKDEELAFIEGDPILSTYYNYFARLFMGTWLACLTINTKMVKNSEQDTSDYLAEGLKIIGDQIPGINFITTMIDGTVSLWNGIERKKFVQRMSRLCFMDLEKAFEDLGILARKLTMAQEDFLKQIPTQAIGLKGKIKEGLYNVKAAITGDDVDDPLKRKAVDDCLAIFTAIRDGKPSIKPKPSDLVSIIMGPNYKSPTSVTRIEEPPAKVDTCAETTLEHTTSPSSQISTQSFTDLTDALKRRLDAQDARLKEQDLKLEAQDAMLKKAMIPDVEVSAGGRGAQDQLMMNALAKSRKEANLGKPSADMEYHIVNHNERLKRIRIGCRNIRRRSWSFYGLQVNW